VANYPALQSNLALKFESASLLYICQPSAIGYLSVLQLAEPVKNHVPSSQALRSQL